MTFATLFRKDGKDLASWLSLALVACVPFEFRATPPYPTQLQIVFLALMAVSAPMLVRDRRILLAGRVIQSALVFVAIAWIAAFASDSNVANALKAAARFSAGAGLMCVLARQRDRNALRTVWAVTAVAAAVYGLLDFNGLGFPRLFREAEFYFEDTRRLSGSFEYPNTAAAYYAMSLPLVWGSIRSRPYRFGACALLWAALILTYSRGAFIAAVAVFAAWGILRRTWTPLAPVATALAVYAALSPWNPLLIERVTQFEARPVRSAKYEAPYNRIREKPGTISEMPLTLRNTGRETWQSGGDRNVRLSYFWYDTVRKEIVGLSPIETPLPNDVPAGGSITVNARFETPAVPGSYLLDWDLRYGSRGAFTLDGIPPAVVEADIHGEAAPARESADVSRWYRKPHDPGPTAQADLQRRELWRAAGLLAMAHPILGIGPDNYRLVYGRMLGFAQWDRNIHSNSLYLEILVGTGAAGLMAFLFMMLNAAWRCTPAMLSLGVAMIHGVVDFFLMTTPVYFAFWILMGSGIAEAHEDRI